MHRPIEIWLVLVVACIPLVAGSMPSIVVTNKSDSMILITPIDEAHTAPPPLDRVSATLPPGTFILTNRTATQINAVVVLWSYTDKGGISQQMRFNCDGYITGGVPTPIVRANDSTLISPGGCTMREYFDHMAAGKPMLGDDLYLARNKSVLDLSSNLATVRLTVDSVIFEDGRIWGPDANKYYKTVSANYWATHSVVEEVSAARAAGQDVRAALEKIAAEGPRSPAHRRLCASTIHDSPDPEATLRFYIQQPPLPGFQHVGGETK